jgi:hypothetical protein
MPVSVARAKGRPIWFFLQGHYGFADVLSFIAAIDLKGVDAPNDACVLDIRDSEETRSAQELRTLARHLAESGFESCFVIASRDVHYGLGRMLSVYAENRGLPVRVFRAEAWEGKRGHIQSAGEDHL